MAKAKHRLSKKFLIYSVENLDRKLKQNYAELCQEVQLNDQHTSNLTADLLKSSLDALKKRTFPSQ